MSSGKEFRFPYEPCTLSPKERKRAYKTTLLASRKESSCGKGRRPRCGKKGDGTASCAKDPSLPTSPIFLTSLSDALALSHPTLLLSTGASKILHGLLTEGASQLDKYDDLEMRSGMDSLTANLAASHFLMGVVRFRSAFPLSPRVKGAIEFLAMEVIDMAGRIAEERGSDLVTSEDVAAVFATDVGLRTFFQGMLARDS